MLKNSLRLKIPTNIPSLFILVVLAFMFKPCYSQPIKEWVELGDNAFKNENYLGAIQFYLKAYNKEVPTDIYRPYELIPYVNTKKESEEKPQPISKNSKKKPAAIKPKLNQPAQMQQYIYHQLAESYRLNHDYKNAELWYKNTLNLSSPLLYSSDYFWYGDALMKNGNYQAATTEFETIIKLGERKNPALFQLAKVKIQGCKLTNDSSYYNKDTKVMIMDSLINKGSTSFSAGYFNNFQTILFTSARSNTKREEAESENSKVDCDIYMAKKSDSDWNNIEKMDNAINSTNHEAAGCLSADKTTYYFTRWSNPAESFIYVSKLNDEHWSAAEKLSETVNIPGYKTMHPFLSQDGTVLYFSSNRSGGQGKMDLWYVKMDNGKIQGNPVNMGSRINTTEDEVSPFIHFPTNTFYFSSDGLPGFGGLDVFQSTIEKNTSLTTPENTGFPINSSKDDAYFVIDEDQAQGFISSDREECTACTGGACYKIYSIQMAAKPFEITGDVYNAETSRLIENALVTVNGLNDNDEAYFTYTDSLGHFLIPIKKDKALTIKIQKNGFFGDALTVTTTELILSKSTSFDFFLSEIPNEEMIIPGVEYEKNKASIQTKSFEVLNNLSTFLKLNNNLKVEIGCYTNEKKDWEDNLKLSEQRAKTVVSYLILNDIDAGRLVPKGYGEKNPLIPDAETEEELQKNRRTVLRTINEQEVKPLK